MQVVWKLSLFATVVLLGYVVAGTKSDSSTINHSFCRIFDDGKIGVSGVAISEHKLYLLINNELYQMPIESFDGEALRLTIPTNVNQNINASAKSGFSIVNFKEKLDESGRGLKFNLMFITHENNKELKCFCSSSKNMYCYNDNDKISSNNILEPNSRFYLNGSGYGYMVSYNLESKAIIYKKGLLNGTSFTVKQTLTLYRPTITEMYFVLVDTSVYPDITKITSKEIDRFCKNKSITLDSEILAQVELVNPASVCSGIYYRKHIHVFSTSSLITFNLDYDNFSPIQVSKINWTRMANFVGCNHISFEKMIEMFSATSIVICFMIIVLSWSYWIYRNTKRADEILSTQEKSLLEKQAKKADKSTCDSLSITSASATADQNLDIKSDRSATNEASNSHVLKVDKNPQ